MAAAAHWLRSLVALFREDVPTALTCLQDTLAAVDRVAPDAPPFLPAVTMAVVLIPCAGRWVPAFEETALIGSQVGRAQAPGYVWSAIGTAHRLQRDLGSAVAVVRRAADVFGSVADDAGSALALHQLGCIERDLWRVRRRPGPPQQCVALAPPARRPAWGESDAGQPRAHRRRGR